MMNSFTVGRSFTGCMAKPAGIAEVQTRRRISLVNTDRGNRGYSAYHQCGAGSGAGSAMQDAFAINAVNTAAHSFGEADAAGIRSALPMKRHKPDTFKCFLQANPGRMIAPKDVVERFGCESHLKQAFAASLNAFMCALECSCESLAGEDGSLEEPECDVLCVARNEMCHELLTVLASEACCQEELLYACRKVYDKYARQEIGKRKALLSAYVDGIEALTLFAASSNRVEQVSALISRRFESVKLVCSRPPRALLECMNEHGISSTFLTVMFDYCGSTVDKAAAMLSQYLGPSAWKLHDACIKANAILHEQLALANDAPFWSQIMIDDRITHRLHDFEDDVCIVFPPPHSNFKQRVCFRRPQCNVGALRVLRFLKSVQLCVTSGLFSNAISTDHLLATCDRLDAAACDKPTICLEWTPPCTYHVPEELKRDLNILIAIEKCIPEGPGCLDVGKMTDLLMQKGGFFCGSTRRSVEQAVHHVMRKCAHHILKRLGNECGIAYVKSDQSQCTMGRLNMDAAGSARMRMRVRDLVTCICSPSRKVRSEWRASRSSRSVAAAARRELCSSC